MPYPQFDRHQLQRHPLAEREDRVFVERDFVSADAAPPILGDQQQRIIDETVARLRDAREHDKPRMLAFGAHTIKNGLAPVLIDLLERGWLTHLATNGAGIIHDWEFAYQGHSSEHVEPNVASGAFGLWEETGFYINLALRIGAYRGYGYGESIGALVLEEGLPIPRRERLERQLRDAAKDGHWEEAAAAADLLQAVDQFDLAPGWMPVPHPHKNIGLQAAARRLDIPFTGHPMFGHDIIYEHPMNHGAAVGRCAERDWLAFAEGVSHINRGVYMSIGSAVMSPMIFEKSMAMARNLALQRGEKIDNHYMLVVDLQQSAWDWSQGEPPEDNPDYYLRFNKSFSRMGGALRYLCADNRDFLLALSNALS